MQTHMLAAALQVAEDWPVFPCKPDNKAPYTKNGFKDATQDPAKIKQWWRLWPDAMVGIPTGKASGTVCLDLDRKEGGTDGVATWNAWIAEDGVQQTRVHQTPSTGQHWLFAYYHSPFGIRNMPLDKLAAGIEVKADGGYIIVPPSRMLDGKEYRVLNDADIAAMPPWLQDNLNFHTLEREIQKDEGKGIVIDDEPVKSDKHEDDVSPEKIDMALDAYSSDGYHKWFYTGCALYDRFGEAGFDVWDKWSSPFKKYSKAECAEKWLECKKVKGFHAGTIFYYADEYDYSWRDRYREFRWQKEDEGHHANQNIEFDTSSWWRAPESIPPREFLYNKHYIRKYISATIGAPGRAKTSLNTVEFISMACGINLLTGAALGYRLRVAVFNAEEDQDELDRRFAAACKHYNVTREMVDGHLFVKSLRKYPPRFAYLNQQQRLTINQKALAKFRDYIVAKKLDAWSFDPFISFHGLRESANEEMDYLVKVLLGGIAEETNSAGAILHHPRKPNPGQIDTQVDDARGASALIAAVRAARVLNFMTKDEASKLGIPSDERHRYVRVSNGKANMGPLDKAVWLHIDPIPLGNATAELTEDEVAVVVSWRPPEPLEGLSTVEIIAIQNLAQQGKYRTDSRAKEWFGLILAKHLNVPASATNRLKNIISQLIAKKYLAVKKQQDNHRNERDYIVVGSEQPVQVDMDFGDVL